VQVFLALFKITAHRGAKYQVLKGPQMLHEPTTTITDFILGIEALAFGLILVVGRAAFPSLPYWIAAMILLGIAAILGGIAHGLAYQPLFLAVYPTLSALIATLSIATIIDGFGIEIAARWRWPVIGLAILFILVALRFPRQFQIFAVFEGIVMLGVLAVYLWLAAAHALIGSGYIAAGIGITLLAAVLYMNKVGFTLIWHFNHNDVYHLIQMVGVLFLFLGLFVRSGGT
jgi:hypothetical protein